MVMMQDEPDLEYAKMKDFLSFYAQRYLAADGLPLDKQPIASLEALEKKSLTMALNGLRQAINDCVEMSIHFDHKEVERLNSQLRRITKDNGDSALNSDGALSALSP